MAQQVRELTMQAWEPRSDSEHHIKGVRHFPSVRVEVWRNRQEAVWACCLLGLDKKWSAPGSVGDYLTRIAHRATEDGKHSTSTHTGLYTCRHICNTCKCTHIHPYVRAHTHTYTNKIFSSSIPWSILLIMKCLAATKKVDRVTWYSHKINVLFLWSFEILSMVAEADLKLTQWHRLALNSIPCIAFPKLGSRACATPGKNKSPKKQPTKRFSVPYTITASSTFWVAYATGFLPFQRDTQSLHLPPTYTLPKHSRHKSVMLFHPSSPSLLHSVYKYLLGVYCMLVSGVAASISQSMMWHNSHNHCPSEWSLCPHWGNGEQHNNTAGHCRRETGNEEWGGL